MEDPDETLTTVVRANPVRSKWGIASDPGFLTLPYVVMLHQARLGLTSEMLNVLLNILAHWHAAGRMPYPHSNTIAKRMGVSTRSVQRAIAQLIEQGFMAKVPRKKRTDPQAYDMKPLVKKLEPYAEARVRFIQLKQYEEILSDRELEILNRPTAAEMFKNVLPLD